MKLFPVVSVLSLGICLNICISVHSMPPAKNYVRPCYFTTWAQYRQLDGKYSVSDYVPGICTHIMYAFAKFNSSYLVYSAEWNDEGPNGQYAKVNQLKVSDPGLKTSLSFGWNNPYKTMAATQSDRSIFVNSAIQFARDHDFDGLDIDWEFPDEDDKANFVLLFKDLREAIDAEVPPPGKSPLELTAAVSSTPSTIDAGYDVPQFAMYIDFMMVMSYDFRGSWNTVTGHHSPLFGAAQGEAHNTEYAAEYWNQEGMPNEKIVIGIATYARGWTLLSSNDSNLGAPAIGKSNALPFTNRSGFGAYYEVCALLEQGAVRHWSEEQQVPYLVQGDQWFGYDDKESVKSKMGWLKQKGYLGAFVWSLDMDDFNGQCGETYPLLGVMRDELNSPCTSVEDTDIQGGDLQAVLGQAHECCEICVNVTGCKAYAWTDCYRGTCWLKSASWPLVPAAGVKVGIIGGAPCVGVSEWESNTVYMNGNHAIYNGVLYKAQWWTKRHQPDNPQAVQFFVWKHLGPC